MKQVNSNSIAEAVISGLGGSGCFMDKNNIVWKFVNGEWVGKRSVWTFDRRSCWLEDTTVDNVKEWWCGEKSDYNEIFKH